MSSTESIFLRTGLRPDRAAERIADTLGMQRRTAAGGAPVLVRTLAGGGEVGGELTDNYLATPEPDPAPDEVSLLDGYDTVLELWSTVPDEPAQRAAAERVFRELTERLPWPAALVHNLDVLVAAWTPDRGRTDFPAGTSPDGDDVARWGPYRPS